MGNDPLFRGLAIHEHWDWHDVYPVVRLSFGGKYNQPSDLDADIHTKIDSSERWTEVSQSSRSDAAVIRFRNLLDRLHHETGKQVVVLVDEYDKLVLDVLDDPEMAKTNLDQLLDPYGVIKNSAAHIRFVFVTGVTMFPKRACFLE